MKNRRLERGSHHLVLVMVAVIALIGLLGFVGYNAWQKQNTNAGSTSTLGTSRDIVYDLYGSNSGVHSLSSTGADTVLGIYSNVQDVSSDGQWLLVGGPGSDISAVSVGTKAYIKYIDASASRRCGTNSTQDVITAQFVKSKSSTTPPPIYYSTTNTTCNTVTPLSAAVYRVDPGGTSKKTILTSSQKGTWLALRGVGNNETVLVEKDTPTSHASITIASTGVKKAFGDAVNSSLSPNGKKFVYQSYVHNTKFEVGVDGSGKVQLNIPTSTYNITVNNDGSRVAYLDYTNPGKQKLYVYTVSGKVKTLVDTSIYNISNANLNYDWSTDGTALVFEHKDTTIKQYQLRTASASGASKKVVKNLSYSPSAWSMVYWR